jgi:hypothetical protein
MALFVCMFAAKAWIEFVTVCEVRCIYRKRKTIKGASKERYYGAPLLLQAWVNQSVVVQSVYGAVHDKGSACE